MEDQKQLENMEHFNCLGSLMTYNTRCTREIKYKFAMAKQHPTRSSFHQEIGLKFEEEISEKLQVGGVVVCGAAIWKLREVDQRYLESFVTWCCVW